MSRKNSRRKGSGYEIKLARKLSVWWDPDGGWDDKKMMAGESFPFRRTPLSGGFDRKMFPGDIITPSDFPFHLEAKNRQSWSFDKLLTTKHGGELVSWITEEEEKKRQVNNEEPVWLVFTKNHAPDYIMMDQDTFFTILPKHDISFIKVSNEIGEFHICLLDDFLTIFSAEDARKFSTIL